MTEPLDRRTFLRRGALGSAGIYVLGGGGLAAFLAACGSDKKSTTTQETATTIPGSNTGSTAAGKSLGTLDYQLSWIKNVEFAGEYLADTNGYYLANGFSSVNLISGGPNVQQDTVVASGKALIGISAPDITGPAIVKGAPLVAVGAQYQKNPFAIVSRADKPLKTPQDMIGKKVGVQSTNEPVWNAFLKANNIDPKSITLVPAQFDPTPLAAGEVDGWFSFITNEPNVLKEKGVDTASFLLNDFNYPLVSQIMVVRKESLTKDRDKLKAVLKSEIQGWRDSIKDPAAGAKLAAEKYGKDLGLNAEEQTLESKSQNELILTDETKANGIFTVTDARAADTLKTLGLGGVTLKESDLFDFSILKEIYDENPDLKKSPV